MLFFGSKWDELCREWECGSTPKSASDRRVASLTFRRTNPTLTKRSIAQLMTQRLLGSPYVALHDLRCDYCDGTLTLRGRVPTFHTKQVAISLAVQLEGVTAVVDRVEVVERPQNPATT